MMDTEMILVTAPNEAGRKFIKLLMYKKMPFAVLTNSAGKSVDSVESESNMSFA
ncbi:hypothetical protein Q0F98_25470 [Paenibacillus amylolyticus]|nr:hypothetical protein Q0F98_25470 [Paenibacillus amylolyticus]